MIVVSQPSKAIRAPIVWNRPTAGMFDYHYDLAGLYYQVVVIAMNAKTVVKETDTSPSSRWSTTVKSERRVEHGGWSTCQIVLSPTLTREPSEMFFSPPRLWFIRNHIKLWHFFIIFDPRETMSDYSTRGPDEGDYDKFLTMMYQRRMKDKNAKSSKSPDCPCLCCFSFWAHFVTTRKSSVTYIFLLILHTDFEASNVLPFLQKCTLFAFNERLALPHF